MPGISVGSASVAIVPSAIGFSDSLRDELLPEMDDLGTELGEALRDAIERQLQDITVTLAADTEQADAAVDDLSERLDDLDAKPTEVEVTADTAEADVAVDDLREKLDELEATHAEVSVGLTDSGAQAKLAALESEIDALELLHRDITIGAGGSAPEEIEALSGMVDDLRDRLDDLRPAAEGAAESLAQVTSQVATGADRYASADAQIDAIGRGMSATAAEAADLDSVVLATDEDLADLNERFFAAAAELGQVEQALGGATPATESLTGKLSSLGDGLQRAGMASAVTTDELEGMERQLDLIGDGLDNARGGIADLDNVQAQAVEGLNDWRAEYEQAGDDLSDVGADADQAAAGIGKTGDAAGSAHPLMMGLVGAALLIGPAFIGAAAGAALFVGSAIPEIDELIHHTGPFRNDLAAIKAEYMQLSDAVKPEVITGFDEALDQAKQILPEFTSAAIAGGKGVDSLIEQFGNFAQSGDTKQFLSFVGGETQSDMQSFGNLLQGLATLGFGFAESLNGISKTLINIVGGLASFGGEVLREVPWLGQWAVAVGGMYVAAEKIPELWAKIAASNFAQWLTGDEEGLVALKVAFLAAAEEGTVLDGVMAALDEVNPLVWAAAGAVAIGALVGVMMNVGDSSDDLTAALARQDDAAGGNIAGYQKLSSQLSGASGAQVAYKQTVDTTNEGMEQGHLGIDIYAQSINQVSAAQQVAAAHADNLNANYDLVAKTLGITAGQAMALTQNVKGAGAAMAQGGEAGIQAADKVIAYGQAGAKAAGEMTQLAVDTADASNTMLPLASRVTDLSTALTDLAGSTGTELENAAQFEDSLTTLQGDLKTSKGSLDLFTASGRASAEALAQVINEMPAGAAGFLALYGSTGKALIPMEQLRGELESIQNPTQAEKNLLAQLNAEINALHSKEIDIAIHVNETGGLGTAGSLGDTIAHLGGGAGGAVIPGYAPGRDSVHMMLSPGESVLVPELTAAIGPDAIMAANRAASRGRSSTPGHMAGGGIAGVSSTLGGGGGADVFNVFVSLLGNTGDYSTSYKGIDEAEDLAQEFADGTLKTVTEIRDAGTKAIDDLRDYYTGPHAALLESALGKQTDALEKLAAQSKNIASEISNAKSIVSSEKTSLASFSDISNITGGTDANGNPLPVTGSEIASGLQSDLSTLHQFFNVIKQLQHAKVSKSLIQQVIAMGPTSGLQYGEAILSGGAALIKEINSIESSIGSEETKVGQATADVQYGLPIGRSIGKGFLSGLDEEKAELEKRMRALGDEMADEFDRALHGTVPTSVAEAVSSDAMASAASIGGTLTAAKPVTHEDAQQIVGRLQDVSEQQLKLASAQQATEIIALLKSAPKATGSAAGAAVADALNTTAAAAAAKARATVRR